MEKQPKIAIIIPCYNEELSIETVIRNFKNELPKAHIYVFDNASTDTTADLAEKSGATIHHVPQQGKGYVVQAMFRDIDADYYLMVDGDETYPISEASTMLSLMLTEQADMLVGNRMTNYHNSQSRSGHHTGNKIITNTVNYLFHSNFKDLLSGYRILSRRFVKSTPLFSQGFEVETALSIHAIEVGAKIIETPIEYSNRPQGSESKLRTLKDGLKITWTIFRLFKDYKPIVVYGNLAFSLLFLSLVAGFPVIREYMATGLVPKFPSAILASGLMILSSLSIFTGVILSAISKSRREIKKLAFLSLQ